MALDPETVAALSSHRDTQLLERDFAADAYQDQDLVFCDQLGGPVRPETLSRLSPATAGPPASRPGRFIRCATRPPPLMLTSGIPVQIAAARLGDRAETVLSTYAHLPPQSDEMAAERVAAALAVG